MPADMKDVVILFVDIRGFTRWSNSVEVFPHLAEFVGRFLHLLATHFRTTKTKHHPLQPVHALKPLGDGAMIVRQVSPLFSAADSTPVLEDVLASITRVNDEFGSLCQDFREKVGEKTAFALGWGVSRGKAIRLDGDYLGHNVNKAARLCDAARPCGVVIDAEDFPHLPTSAFRFHRQERVLAGLDTVDAWVTDEVFSQFLTREQVRHRPEVHVAGMCFDPTAKAPRVLLARRSAKRRLYPTRWEGCGGQLAEAETFAEGVRRHFKLELNLDVRVLEHLHLFYDIREPSQLLIPGVRFACERVGDTPPTSANHTEFRWVNRSDLTRMSDAEFVPGLKRQTLDMMTAYSKDRS